MSTKSTLFHKLTALAGLTLLLSVFALGGCGDKKSDDKGKDKAPDMGAAPAGGGKKAADLKAAWEADKNCQSLVKCCEEIKGTGWEQTIGALCKALPEMMNFEERAKNLVDPAFQANHCKNALQSAVMMGNDANPVPASCAAAGKPEMPK